MPVPSVYYQQVKSFAITVTSHIAAATYCGDQRFLEKLPSVQRLFDRLPKFLNHVPPISWFLGSKFDRAYSTKEAMVAGIILNYLPDLLSDFASRNFIYYTNEDFQILHAVKKQINEDKEANFSKIPLEWSIREKIVAFVQSSGNPIAKEEIIREKEEIIRELEEELNKMRAPFGVQLVFNLIASLFFQHIYTSWLNLVPWELEGETLIFKFTVTLLSKVLEDYGLDFLTSRVGSSFATAIGCYVVAAKLWDNHRILSIIPLISSLFERVCPKPYRAYSMKEAAFAGATWGFASYWAAGKIAPAIIRLQVW